MANLAVIVMACIALSGPFGMLATTARAQTPANGQATAVSLPPGMVDVIGLTKAGFSEDGILAKVKSAGQSYDLTTEQMIYLKNQGVSENIISALLQAGPATTPPPPVNTPSVTTPPPTPSVVTGEPPSPPAPASTSSGGPPEAGTGESSTSTTAAPAAEPVVNFDYFHDQLAPWGTWVELPGIGPVWKPADSIIMASPDWRPYYDNGQWVHTDNGLFWQSDYTWGDIPFHYGRWIITPTYGWVWVPDYTWGPAWVFWRHDEDGGAVGWAPLPVGAVFVDGVFVFNGVHVAADFDFGLGENYFVFVDGAHFHERYFRLRGREWRYHIDRERLHGFYGRSVIRNDFRRDDHGRFVNEGIGRDRIDRMTNHRLEEAKMEERHPVGDREKAAQQPGAGGERGGAKSAPSKVFRPPAASAQKSGSGGGEGKKK